MTRPQNPRRSRIAPAAVLTRVRASVRARRRERQSYAALSERLDAVEAPAAPDSAVDRRYDELRDRLERLEKVVEGLQDAVYREAQRLNDAVAELRTRIEPSAIARALSDDARKRGL